MFFGRGWGRSKGVMVMVLASVHCAGVGGGVVLVWVVMLAAMVWCWW